MGYLGNSCTFTPTTVETTPNADPPVLPSQYNLHYIPCDENYPCSTDYPYNVVCNWDLGYAGFCEECPIENFRWYGDQGNHTLCNQFLHLDEGVAHSYARKAVEACCLACPGDCDEESCE